MNGIDELTLRLLTSKKKYNAYLETVEPDKSAEIRDYCKSVKANRKRIITLFESYLDDPEEIAAWQKHRERQRMQSLPRKSTTISEDQK